MPRKHKGLTPSLVTNRLPCPVLCLEGKGTEVMVLTAGQGPHVALHIRVVEFNVPLRDVKGVQRTSRNRGHALPSCSRRRRTLRAPRHLLGAVQTGKVDDKTDPMNTHRHRPHDEQRFWRDETTGLQTGPRHLWPVHVRSAKGRHDAKQEHELRS